MTDERKILVNGKEYHLGEVPEMLRPMLADKNQNGIPDIVEQILQNPMVKNAMARAGAGQAFHNLDQLPPELREKVQKVFQRLGMQVPAGQAAAPRESQQATPGNLMSASPAPTPIDWNKVEAPEEPKSISPKTLALVLAMIFSLLVVCWVAFMFLLKK